MLSRRAKFAITAVAAVALGTASGVTYSMAQDGSEGSRDAKEVPPQSSEPTVAANPPKDSDIPSGVLPDGRTYGPAPVAPDGGQFDGEGYMDNLPDLVSVLGDHGVSGYADSNLVFGDGDFDSPEDVAAYVEATKNGMTIPVYDEQGKKVDTFTLQQSPPNR